MHTCISSPMYRKKPGVKNLIKTQHKLSSICTVSPHLVHFKCIGCCPVFLVIISYCILSTCSVLYMHESLLTAVSLVSVVTALHVILKRELVAQVFSYYYYCSVSCMWSFAVVLQALSNQKYRELYEEFQDVGLMTGDVTINPSASALVMTTEVRRNWFLH